MAERTPGNNMPTFAEIMRNLFSQNPTVADQSSEVEPTPLEASAVNSILDSSVFATVPPVSTTVADVPTQPTQTNSQTYVSIDTLRAMAEKHLLSKSQHRDRAGMDDPGLANQAFMATILIEILNELRGQRLGDKS